MTGSVTLGGNLNVSLGVGYTPSPGDSFVIVNNEGANPISGTFNGLPEGACWWSAPTSSKFLTRAAPTATT